MEQVTEFKFNEIISKSKDTLIVVDLWAEWCLPCRMMKPIFEELSEEYNDVSIIGVNIDETPTIASTYGIRNIPTILFFKNGQPIDRLVGAVPKSRIKEKIDILNQ